MTMTMMTTMTALKKAAPYILGIPTYTRYDLLEGCLRSFFRSEHPPEHCYVIDNGSLLKQTHAHLTPLWEDKLTVQTMTHNIGVAAAWNLIIESWMVLHPTCPYLLLANDDIEVAPSTPGQFTAFHRAGIVVNAEAALNGFSLFRLDRNTVMRLGRFDEQFYPAYYEDNDYKYRAKLQGVPVHDLVTDGYAHVGSATIAQYDDVGKAEHHRTFLANQAYYLQKWGGLPMQETYQTPFNLPHDAPIEALAATFPPPHWYPLYDDGDYGASQHTT
jgi:GT2 family glycosyltransferase